MPIELIPVGEQIIRKKAEEKPKTIPEAKPSIPAKVPIPTKPHKPKYKVPTIIPPETVIRSGVPVIPSDTCCEKICQTLNDTIENKKNFLSTALSSGESHKLYETGEYRTTNYYIDSLESYRQELKDKGACKCVEETGATSIMLPLIQANTIISKPKEYIQEPPRLKGVITEEQRTIHRKDKPIIPTTNSCCTQSCKIINDKIDRNNKILDNMELRGGPYVFKNPRYEALVYRTLSLQDYRKNLIDKGGCKCIE